MFKVALTNSLKVALGCSKEPSMKQAYQTYQLRGSIYTASFYIDNG